MLSVVTTNAYALRFDPETGTGFISKGEIQSGFGMTDAEVQEAFTKYPVRTVLSFSLYWDVLCLDGEQLYDMGYETTLRLNNELRTNPQGRVTGIELTGYQDENYEELIEGAIEGGPGSVCTNESEKSRTFKRIEYNNIELQFQGISKPGLSSASIYFDIH
jgi:hypothetical protein